MNTGRVKVIRKEQRVIDGREKTIETEFYECWCEVQILTTTEKYTAMQTGLENTIVFKVRNCKRMEEIRLNMKEFYAIYKDVEFKIYDATPMYTDERSVLLKCKSVS